MSSKDLDQIKDVTTQQSIVQEVIPLTGTFFSGNLYTKKYINVVSGSAVSGGFWETIWDGSPTSISSSALVDLTFGTSVSSSISSYSETFMLSQKQRIYKEFAGHLLNDRKGLFTFNNVRFDDLFFISFQRRIFKDEIKKGDTRITVQVSGTVNNTLILSDVGAATSFTVGPAGDQAPLFSGSTQVGQVYYNAGIVAIGSGAFGKNNAINGIFWSGSIASAHSGTLMSVAVTGNIDHVVDGLKNRMNQCNFNNQTNLHSTIYFCTANHDEFNYSSNPSFLDSDGRIIPTSGTDNQTRSYITKVAGMDIQNNVLWVASLSEPVKKSSDAIVSVKVRLSYGFFLPFILPFMGLINHFC